MHLPKCIKKISGSYKRIIQHPNRAFSSVEAIPRTSTIDKGHPNQIYVVCLCTRKYYVNIFLCAQMHFQVNLKPICWYLSNFQTVDQVSGSARYLHIGITKHVSFVGNINGIGMDIKIRNWLTISNNKHKAKATIQCYKLQQRLTLQWL